MVIARVGRVLGHHHLSGRQRLHRLGVLGRVGGITIHILHDPFRQPALDFFALLERTNLIADDALEIVCEATGGEQVRQSCRQLCIGGGIGVVVLGRLVQRLRTDESREIAVLAVHQRHETVLRSSASRRSSIAISVGHFM